MMLTSTEPLPGLRHGGLGRALMNRFQLVTWQSRCWYKVTTRVSAWTLWFVTTTNVDSLDVLGWQCSRRRPVLGVIR